MATGSGLELQRVGHKPGDISVCQAYDSFKAALQDVRSSYQHLNPERGRLLYQEHELGEKVLEPHVVQQLMRGAVISVLSIWEFYVVNLLSEAFNHVVHIHSEVSTPEYSSDESNGADYRGSYKELRKIKKEWPDCQTVIQNAFKRKGELIKKPMEVVMFKLLTSACPHLQLLQEHRDHVLRGCSPLLLGDGGIEEAFHALFYSKTKKGKIATTHSLSNTIVMLGLQYDFISSTDTGTTQQAIFKSAEAVNDVLRLYYGARCIFSHGLPGKTLSEGALRNFPNKQQLTEGMGGPAAATDLICVFEELKNSGRKASFTYLDLCMLYRFFLRLANRLMVAVAFQIHNISPKIPPLWNYPNYFLRDMVIESDSTASMPRTRGDAQIPTVHRTGDDDPIPTVPLTRSGGGDPVPSVPWSGGDGK